MGDLRMFEVSAVIGAAVTVIMLAVFIGVLRRGRKVQYFRADYTDDDTLIVRAWQDVGEEAAIERVEQAVYRVTEQDLDRMLTLQREESDGFEEYHEDRNIDVIKAHSISVL